MILGWGELVILLEVILIPLAVYDVIRRKPVEIPKELAWLTWLGIACSFWKFYQEAFR